MNFVPSDLIKDSIDVYIANYSTTSQKIYWIVLIAIVTTLIALPFIYVDISIQEPGIIRPVTEKTEIKANFSEIIDSVFVKEGQTVHRGDTLLIFRQASLDLQIHYQQQRINDFLEHISDLSVLSKGDTPKFFRSSTRQQEYVFYMQQKNEHETSLFKAEKDLNRAKQLFDKKVIAEEEYDNFYYEYNKAKNAIVLLRDNQLSKWQGDLNDYFNSIEEMKMTMKRELKNKDLYVVLSPVSGTLDHFRGIYRGSNIQAGSLLVIISPDSTLFAEINVSPRNIGYIYLGMPVQIRVSSFNYNEWGAIPGEVFEISSDFLIDNIGNKAYYKVKCKLTNNYLTHKKGLTGKLKKGMNLSSHFMITRKSLFDLIYQKMDDWVNPTQYMNNQIIQNEQKY